jgi:hypothetical protein
MKIALLPFFLLLAAHRQSDPMLAVAPWGPRYGPGYSGASFSLAGTIIKPAQTPMLDALEALEAWRGGGECGLGSCWSCRRRLHVGCFALEPNRNRPMVLPCLTPPQCSCRPNHIITVRMDRRSTNAVIRDRRQQFSMIVPPSRSISKLYPSITKREPQDSYDGRMK